MAINRPDKLTVRELNKKLPEGQRFARIYAARGLVFEIRVGKTKTTRRWFFRSPGAKGRMDISMGTYPEISQQEAREKADQYWALVKDGIDPRKQEKPSVLTVSAVFESWLKESPRLSQLKNPAKTERDSRTRFKNYFSEEFRQLDCKAVTAKVVAKDIKDCWDTKHESAVKILRDLKLAFDFALDKEVIEGSSPIDIARIERLLGKAPTPPRNHPALPVDRIPELFLELCSYHRLSISALALAYNILTASRSGSLFKGSAAFQTGMEDKEFENYTTSTGRVIKVQRVPGGRMKGQDQADRLIPLSAQALEVVDRARELRPDGATFVFCTPGARRNTCLTRDAMRNQIKRLDELRPGYWVDPHEIDPATGKPSLMSPHGTSRATFRDWATNPVRYGHPAFSESDIELCLSHITAKYGTSYSRDPRIEQLLEIFEEWGKYCFSLIEEKRNKTSTP